MGLSRATLKPRLVYLRCLSTQQRYDPFHSIRRFTAADDAIKQLKNLTASPFSPGFYDYMVKAHEKIGARYVGRWLHGGFHMYLKTQVKSIEDLKGKKIRTGPLYVFFLDKLGAAPVSIKPSDVYTSLERGVAEGFCWPILGARESGWTEICKQVIDHSFYEGDGTILVNSKKWESLPGPVREKILQMMPKYEEDMVKYYDDAIVKERDLMAKAGCQFYKLDPKEAAKFTQLAYDAWWEFMMTKVPDLVPNLKKMTGN